MLNTLPKSSKAELAAVVHTWEGTEIAMGPSANWDALESKFAKLTASRGLDYLTPELRDRYHVELIYVSSNLEHIALTWEEAEVIVSSFPQAPDLDMSAASVLQAIGQKRALELLETEAASNEIGPQAQLIKQLHYELMRDVEPDEAGQYRSEHRAISGSKVMTSMPSIIGGEMATLSARVEASLNSDPKPSIKETIELASREHHELTRIHPFSDGNGRVARLYMNYLCRLRHLPYVLLPKVGVEDVMNYSLKEADAGDLSPAINLYGSLLEDSLDRVLAHFGLK